MLDIRVIDKDNVNTIEIRIMVQKEKEDKIIAFYFANTVLKEIDVQKEKLCRLAILEIMKHGIMRSYNEALYNIELDKKNRINGKYRFNS